jgi:hypothetical protein
MVRAGLGYLAAADPGQLPAATQAECLRELEQDAAALTAARAWLPGRVSPPGRATPGDGDYSAVSWLIHRTGITRGAAVGHQPGLSGSPHTPGDRGAGRRAGLRSRQGG